MSRRSKTQCSRHAGTATRTSSTNLTSFHHMVFGRGALCRWGRVIRQPPAPVSLNSFHYVRTEHLGFF
ncbi:hypothetical protein N658DRAFT_495768 [Parathielavia hyrcaniae]|uniref:Uncharacterized protein n=1 Tax=Parathielavia hyrcaniae TaxID=113614 RepID=A0AAN6T2N0_9PEZI|nr:hypothetical protein N658DRAFT_495768 [Parathielavia hyrcaniae]